MENDNFRLISVEIIHRKFIWRSGHVYIVIRRACSDSDVLAAVSEFGQGTQDKLVFFISCFPHQHRHTCKRNDINIFIANNIVKCEM